MEKSKRLSIDGYRLEELTVAANPTYRDDDKSANEGPLPIAIEFRPFVHRSDPDRFALSLTIKSTEPIATDQPLKFSVSIMGFFSVEEPIVDGMVPPDRAVNGLTILYGIVRGQLGTSAAWFNQTTVLPTVYFSDLVYERIEAEKREAIADSAPQLEAGMHASA